MLANRHEVASWHCMEDGDGASRVGPATPLVLDAAVSLCPPERLQGSLAPCQPEATVYLPSTSMFYLHTLHNSTITCSSDSLLSSTHCLAPRRPTRNWGGKGPLGNLQKEIILPCLLSHALHPRAGGGNGGGQSRSCCSLRVGENQARAPALHFAQRVAEGGMASRMVSLARSFAADLQGLLRARSGSQHGNQPRCLFSSPSR